VPRGRGGGSGSRSGSEGNTRVARRSGRGWGSDGNTGVGGGTRRSGWQRVLFARCERSAVRRLLTRCRNVLLLLRWRRALVRR
jgi:hypothetical protein